MKIRTILFIGVLISLLVPPTTFLVSGLAAEMGLLDTLNAVMDQYGPEARPKLWSSSVISVVPVLGLGLVLWLIAKIRGKHDLTPLLGAAALVALALVLIWSNVSFWLTFLPEQRTPGWPHGLELVVGPLVFAPLAMLTAMLLAWAVGRR